MELKANPLGRSKKNMMSMRLAQEDIDTTTTTPKVESKAAIENFTRGRGEMYEHTSMASISHDTKNQKHMEEETVCMWKRPAWEATRNLQVKNCRNMPFILFYRAIYLY